MRALKWFSWLYTAVAVAIVAVSHAMIINGWTFARGLLPFDVTNGVALAALLAPGAVAAAIHLFLETRSKRSSR